jgi:hypothetical protein
MLGGVPSQTQRRTGDQRPNLDAASGSTDPVIGVHLGGILPLVAGWEALHSIREAVAQAAELAPTEYGSEA